MATTTPNFGWAVPTSTDLVKDGAVAIETLGDSIDASLVDLKGGTTGQVLAKASGTDMDFSWTAIDPLVILDAKGDLITATAADTPARLAVGTNGQTLVADSTASTGLKWATPSSGTLPVLTYVTPTNNFSTSSSTFVDITDYTITRTPVSATNKIQIQANIFFYNTTAQTIVFKGFQGASSLGEREQSYGVGYFTASLLFYVSNNAASSTTFKVQCKGSGATNITVYGSNSGYFSNFSVLEVY